MKLKLIFLAALLASTLASQSGPWQREEIASDAKWMIHLDLEEFRKTQIGSFVEAHMIDKHLSELKSSMKLDANLAFEQLKSITAFGNDYELKPGSEGVLMVKTDAKLQEIVNAMLIQQTLAVEEGGKAQVVKVTDTPYPIYQLHGELFVNVESNRPLLLSKSKGQIEMARRVLDGKADNLSGAATFREFPEMKDSFIFMAVAEGFSANKVIPPQAKFLQMADGARLVLGERAKDLFASLSLKARTPEVTRQIQEILQGIRALATFTMTENQDFQRIVNATSIQAAQKVVTVSLDFPVDAAMDALRKLEPFAKTAMAKEAR